MSQWIYVGWLDESNCDFSRYNKCIGVYKGELKGELVYIGKATERNNGGFRKRLRDYTRISQSARGYSAGDNMFKNKQIIKISIQVVSTVKEAENLEIQLIKKLKPKWNFRG
ncbi:MULTISPECIES: GIY-YIG nuclease family protein [Alteromonadales]|uniref:GIY-YIG domain-containing protein n=1 Tax=Litorilituus sediminis TaxID=718192 RepID=A0A4V0ZFN8_9GAMM|nr:MULTISPECIES: GIY-YIG nuclease family protein [Alteromonadales]QBG34450.1 hypothetical protein EMK97_01205 [Litorilituus sediminis]